jgi:predicted nucleic acid-binding protein
MVSVFVDTSALIAFLDEDEPLRGGCRQAWARGAEEGEGFVTTDYVFLEAVSVAQRRWGLDAVRTLVDEFFPLIHVERITHDDRIAAVSALLAGGRRRLSLVDCSSFVVMRRMRIVDFLGLDPHFAEQGFVAYAATAG